MTVAEWELERMRAWTAFMAGMLAFVGAAVPIADYQVDTALREWEKRFPKPEEKPNTWHPPKSVPCSEEPNGSR